MSSSTTCGLAPAIGAANTCDRPDRSDPPHRAGTSAAGADRPDLTRVPKLFDDLARAHGHGSAGRRLKTLGAVQLLILDDWGLSPLDDQARHGLLEILEDRYGRRSTLVTSQLPVADWHTVIGQATYADALLDRLAHNAHRIELTGESLRRTRRVAAA